MISAFVKARKIHSVAGNLAYLADKEKHPEICEVYATCDKSLWKEYAEVNQKEFAASGKAEEGRCVEAREFVYVCPNEFYRLSAESKKKLLRFLVKQFKKRFGVEVYAALHGSDQDENNLHIHLMFMERTQTAAHEKIATRATYFNERGRQVKAKKDAVDAEGNLLPGYTMVKKGEAYGGIKTWTSKNQYLKSNEFTHQEKIWWANFINYQKDKQPWAEDMEKRVVYDHATSPYLPMQDTGAPLKYRDPGKQEEANQAYQKHVKDVQENNEIRKAYNAEVKAALKDGADLQELVDQRKKISKEIHAATAEPNASRRIKEILRRALKLIERIRARLRDLLDASIRGDKKAGMELVEEPQKNRNLGQLEAMIRDAASRSGPKKTKKPIKDERER